MQNIKDADTYRRKIQKVMGYVIKGLGVLAKLPPPFSAIFTTMQTGVTTMNKLMDQTFKRLPDLRTRADRLKNILAAPAAVGSCASKTIMDAIKKIQEVHDRIMTLFDDVTFMDPGPGPKILKMVTSHVDKVLCEFAIMLKLWMALPENILALSMPQLILDLASIAPLVAAFVDPMRKIAKFLDFLKPLLDPIERELKKKRRLCFLPFGGNTTCVSFSVDDLLSLGNDIIELAIKELKKVLKDVLGFDIDAYLNLISQSPVCLHCLISTSAHCRILVCLIWMCRRSTSAAISLQASLLKRYSLMFHLFRAPNAQLHMSLATVCAATCKIMEDCARQASSFLVVLEQSPRLLSSLPCSPTC
jgi:hypothetical protein